jgi:membrane protease YdiL (CAAX protease family)
MFGLFSLGIGRRRKGWRRAQRLFAVFMSAGLFAWFHSFDFDLRQLGMLQYAASVALGLACGFCRYRYRWSMVSAALDGAYNLSLYIPVLE